MSTPSISNALPVAAAQPSQAARQADGAAPETPFNQVLSREISANAAPAEAPAKAEAGEAPLPVAGKGKKKTADSASAADAAEPAKDDDPVDNLTATADMLAMVANFSPLSNQAAQQPATDQVSAEQPIQIDTRRDGRGGKADATDLATPMTAADPATLNTAPDSADDAVASFAAAAAGADIKADSKLKPLATQEPAITVSAIPNSGNAIGDNTVPNVDPKLSTAPVTAVELQAGASQAPALDEAKPATAAPKVSAKANPAAPDTAAAGSTAPMVAAAAAVAPQIVQATQPAAVQQATAKSAPATAVTNAVATNAPPAAAAPTATAAGVGAAADKTNVVPLTAAHDGAAVSQAGANPGQIPLAKEEASGEQQIKLDGLSSKPAATNAVPPAAMAPLQQAAMQGAQAFGHTTEKLTPNVGSPAWDQALGQKVVWMVAGGQQSATLTLNPPDLGPMQVVLTVNNSQANAAFIAAQPEVRAALEASLPKLREILGDAGIQLGQATVSSGTPNDRAPGDQAPQSSSRSFAATRETAPVETVARPVRSRASTGGSGMVDTFA